jgi:hypothetical protein
MTDVVNLEPLLKRQLAWDILPCAATPSMMKRLGLLPGSAGGDALEHQQSHKRLNRVLPIEADVKMLSGLAGEVVAKAILGDQEMADNDPRLVQYQNTVTACTQAVIANLIESGALKINEGLLAQ